MGRDKYGHYTNDDGVEIRTSTDKNNTDHIDIYDSCPADNPDHISIHVKYNSDTGSGTIVDTTDGDKETTDTQCYLTTACMRHMDKSFDDNCEELKVLRWFRDNFVSQEDINHYYEIAPIIVNEINHINENNRIYNYIYENVITSCVEAIKNGDYTFAYDRYKTSILTLEAQFAKPALEKTFTKILKLNLNKRFL